MSIIFFVDMRMIGDRIKQERQRLALTQEDFSAIASARPRTLIDWEKGISSPTAVQLAALGRIGVDIAYVVTGEAQKDGVSESAVYQAVVDAVDLLSLEKKINAAQLAKAVVKLCARQTLAAAPLSGSQHFEGSMQVFHQAPQGDVVGGDMFKGNAVVIKENVKKGKA